MSTILIVDDEKTYLTYIKRILSAEAHLVHPAQSGGEALRLVAGGLRPDLVLLDIVMPEMDGHQTLTRLLKVAPNLRVVILSALDNPSQVVRAIRSGAMDFLSKECTPTEILAMVRKCIQWAEPPAPVPGPAKSIEEESDKWIFHSKPMREIRKTARQVADLPVKVLLLGESGVGKDVVAHYIHSISHRSGKPFIKVNCAALPSELIESELFGHEKGSFTGAHATQKGKLELAQGGTIFLDEIGDFTLATQAKLLQALEDNEFMRLGGSRPIQINARIIVATNRDLEAAVREGKFRRDLYFRLCVVNITIPPLRERAEAIVPLIRSFLRHYKAEFNPEIPEPGPELLKLFQTYHWPGNVRELQNLVKKYAIFQDGAAIAAELRSKINAPLADEYPDDTGDGSPGPADMSLKDASRRASQAAERRLILRTLEQTNWNRKKAAVLLQISYKAFRYKLKDIGLNQPPGKKSGQ
jgi:two-component system response regulator AtoC